MYTRDFQTKLRLSSPQITMMGQMLLVGVGFCVWPISILYDAPSCRRFRDHLITMISIVATCLTFSLLILAHQAAEHGDPWSPDKTFPLLLIAFLSYGIIAGSTYAHSVWVMMQVFSTNLKIRTIVIASITAAFGTGPAVYSTLYAHVFTRWQPSHFFTSQFALFMVLHVLRFLWCPDDHASSLSSSSPVADPSCLLLNDDQDQDKDQVSWCAFFTNPIVVLTYLCTLLGSGVTGTFLTIAHLVAQSTGSSEVGGEKATSLFLIAHACGRIAAVVILSLNYRCDKYLFGGAFFSTMAGLSVLLVSTNLQTVYVAAVCIGFAFGIVWGVFPVLCTNRYPQDPQFVSIRLAFTITAAAIGSIGFTLVTTPLQPSGICLHPRCFRSVFFAYLGMASVGLILAGWLGWTLHQADRVGKQKTTIDTCSEISSV